MLLTSIRLVFSIRMSTLILFERIYGVFCASSCVYLFMCVSDHVMCVYLVVRSAYL